MGLAARSQVSTPSQKDDTTRISSTYDLENIVVTAQYSPGTAARSTYKVKVIDQKKIESLAAVNLRDALSNELNIRVSQDPVLGSSLSLQGLSGQNVKILVDGVPMIGRQNGSLDLSQINISNVERIEIVEGPLSVNYGTNALAGVINIITKKPRTNAFAAQTNAYYETNNTYNLGVVLSAHKKAQGFALTLNRNYFNGWDAGEPFHLLPVSAPADTNRFKSWKPKEQYFGDLQYSFEKGNFRLNYRAALFNELIINRGFPQKPYYETAFDDYYHTKRLDNSASLQMKLKNYRSFNTTLAFNDFYRRKNTWYKNLTDLTAQMAADPTLQDTARFSQYMARGSFASSKPYRSYADTTLVYNRFNFELGYDLNYNSAYGKRIKNRSQSMGDYALFASGEWQPVHELVVRPGLRFAYNTAYASPVIPSLNLKYSPGAWALRASYARGFRAPDLKELYFEFVDINHNISGNGNLLAEQSGNYNFSAKYHLRRDDGEWSSELSAFYNDIHNLIALALVSGTQYAYVNIGHFKSRGGAVNLRYNYKNLTLSAGASVTGRYNDLAETFASVEPFSYTPEVRASAQYKFDKPKTTVNCFYKYSGRLPGYVKDADGSLSQTFIDPYNMLDVNVNQAFFKNRMALSVGCKNLLGISNVRASMAGGAHSGNSSVTPVAMGRTYFIKLQYVFEK